MKAVVLTQQVSHYHAARYRAAAAVMPGLSILSAMGEAEFPELLSSEASHVPIDVLFRTREAYREAVTSGTLPDSVARQLARREPDVVVVAGWAFPESFAAIAWARRAGKRLVVMSESQAQDAGRNVVREGLKRRVVSLGDAALVGAAAHRDYIVSLGIPADRVFLGYDAVDNGFYERGAEAARADAAALRRSLGLPARYLLASARFVPKKNLPRLVAAYARAIEGISPPDLVLLGDGAERPAIEAAIREHGVQSRVHLPGFRRYDLLPAHYGLAEAFVHVSLVEQWGLVVNEAAASGLPIVVSRACGAASVLVEPGRNGWVVDPTSVEDMARALRSLMTSDSASRVAMGRESRQLVAAWGPDRFGAGLKEACAAALRQPPRRDMPWDRLLVRMLGRRTMAEFQA